MTLLQKRWCGFVAVVLLIVVCAVAAQFNRWRVFLQEIRAVRGTIVYHHGQHVLTHDMHEPNGWTDDELTKAVALVQRFHAAKWRWGLPRIEVLWIERARVTDRGMREVARLEHLKTMVIHYAPISDRGLESLSHLPRCETMTLRGTDNVRGPGLRHLADAPALRSLTLEFSFEHPVDWRYLSALERSQRLTSLDLAGNLTLSDDAVTFLPSLSAIERLCLSWTSVSDETTSKLIALRNLKELNLIRCGKITNESVPYLQQIPSLRMLDITYSGISADGAARLRRHLPDCEVKWMKE